MDRETIIDEVDRFNRNYFFEIESYADENLDFIELNHLHIPKKNYTLVCDFLTDTAKHFRILDNNFMSLTLKKLAYDIKNITTYIETISYKNSKILEIFNDKFIDSSIFLSRTKRELERLISLKNPLNEDIQRLNNLSKSYKSLKTIYFDTFREIFNEENSYLLSLLKTVLNSKVYYFDKLLSKEISTSMKLNDYFHTLGVKQILSTKEYLLYYLSQLQTDTKAFSYLNSCLRIYK